MLNLLKNKKVILIILIIAILFPIAVKDTYLQSIAVMILIFTIASSGWNVLGGYAGQVSFGHGVFFTIGAYATTLIVLKLNMSPWIGIFIGIIACTILSLAIGYPIFRLRNHYFAIATMALNEIVRAYILKADWLGAAVGITMPLQAEGIINFQFHNSKVPYYYIFLIFVIIVLFSINLMNKSRFGFYLRAIRDSERASAALGINSAYYKNMALVMSAIITSIAGSAYAVYVMVIDPYYVIGANMSTMFALMTIFGGMGTIWGPVIGSTVLVSFQQLSSSFFSGSGRATDIIIYSIIIIIIVVIEPKGIVAIFERLKGKIGKRGVLGGDIKCE